MHPEFRDMSSVSYIEEARSWARRLEERERLRSSGSATDARRRVATRAKMLPGTLENLYRRRLKAFDIGWYSRLKALLVDELRQELRHHEHEIQLLLATGADPRSHEMEEAQAGLAKIKAALDARD